MITAFMKLNFVFNNHRSHTIMNPQSMFDLVYDLIPERSLLKRILCSSGLECFNIEMMALLFSIVRNILYNRSHHRERNSALSL